MRLSRLYFQIKILLAVSGTRVQKTLSRVTYTTLHASLSGTFLQTPPELVTPLKGHSISALLSTDAVSALRKVLVLIIKTVNTHVNIRRVRPRPPPPPPPLSFFFNSVQEGICALENAHIWAPPRLPEVSPTLPLKQFQCSSD